MRDGEGKSRLFMPKRKLLIGLTVSGLFLAAFGSTTMSASADQHTCLVTLVGGQQITITAPACTADQVQSQVPGAIASIQDVTPPPASTTPPPPPQPPVTVDAQPAPPSQGGSGSTTPSATTPSSTTPSSTTPAPTQQPQASKQDAQQTTGKAPKNAQDKLKGSGKAASDAEKKAKDKANKLKDNAANGLTNPDGSPADTNPSLSLAFPGPAPIGVPNFFIDKLRIPPFLLPIYQAAGIEYGVRWEILAAINEIETDYGRNLNISSAGAVGWMQFMPGTWKRYGVDANHDGHKDPFNPVDAIFAAARYLTAAGADQDVRRAVFAYNHAGWYVDSVLMRARLIGGLPADLVGSLTGLTQGHFPVHAKARYADAVQPKAKRIKSGNVALPVTSSANRKGINIFAKAGSPAIATQDGRIVRMGENKRLGKFIMLRDVYGNTYTYARLKKLAAVYPVPKEKTVSRAAVAKELKLPKADPKPTAPASAGRQVAPKAKPAKPAPKAAPKAAPAAAPTMRKERLFANPGRPTAFKSGGQQQLLNAGSSIPGYTTYKSYFSEVYGLKRSDVQLKQLKVGSKVIAGTILGRLGRTETGTSPHMLFEIRPAGKDAPRIDPKPILDGWKLLESTAIYRAAGKNPFWGPNSKDPSIGQILLMSKEALQRRVLTDPRISVYDCGRRDIRAGIVDRRVLATLEFLTASGLKPSVSALECGHSLLTSSGNISEHSSGNAVDIAAINGIPIVGHQGPGSITDITIRRLLTLQGTMKPHQIISLMTFDGADNTLALPDHYDHIHVGFQPLDGSDTKAGKQLNSVLKPKQWLKLIDRLGKIDNPTVFTTPSKYSIQVQTPATGSIAHKGD
ncbi:MAG: lytic murein transglycosylase [Solirubrobacteraceae bacterium]